MNIVTIGLGLTCFLAGGLLKKKESALSWVLITAGLIIMLVGLGS